MDNKTIELLESFGLTNIQPSILGGVYGDHYTSDQGDIFISHDSGYIFLNNKLLCQDCD